MNRKQRLARAALRRGKKPTRIVIGPKTFRQHLADPTKSVSKTVMARGSAATIAAANPKIIDYTVEEEGNR